MSHFLLSFSLIFFEEKFQWGCIYDCKFFDDTIFNLLSAFDFFLLFFFLIYKIKKFLVPLLVMLNSMSWAQVVNSSNVLSFINSLQYLEKLLVHTLGAHLHCTQFYEFVFAI